MRRPPEPSPAKLFDNSPASKFPCRARRSNSPVFVSFEPFVVPHTSPSPRADKHPSTKPKVPKKKPVNNVSMEQAR